MTDTDYLEEYNGLTSFLLHDRNNGFATERVSQRVPQRVPRAVYYLTAQASDSHGVFTIRKIKKKTLIMA